MSIEQTDLIDIISIDRLTGETILTISDHLDWSDSEAHLLLLQNKLNRYLAFVESGEIFRSYPKAKNSRLSSPWSSSFGRMKKAERSWTR